MSLSFCVLSSQHTATTLLTAAHSSSRLFAIHRRSWCQLCQSMCQPQCQSTAQTCATIFSRDGLWPVRGHQSSLNCFWTQWLDWTSCVELLPSTYPYSYHRETSAIRPLSREGQLRCWEKACKAERLGRGWSVALLVDVFISLQRQSPKPCFFPNFYRRQGG